MLVNAAVADDLVEVFRQLYEARFPIEAMAIATRQDLEAPPTGDGNVTGAFSCRPVRGGSQYSQHAYGLAVDLNPFHNPYQNGDVVLPELASSYLARDRVRPGMITPDGPVVRAFSTIGWGWGQVVWPQGLSALQPQRSLADLRGPRPASAAGTVRGSGTTLLAGCSPAALGGPRLC